jgi:hypothetical protein
MIQKTLFTLALVSVGTAALAECPQSMSDTGDGVFVSFNDFYVRYDRLADGSVIEQEVYLEDGGGFRVHSISGAFVLQSWDTRHGALIGNTSEVTTYAVGVDNLPTLFPGQTWQGSTVRRHDDGTTNVETVDVLMEPETRMSLGTCSYASWPIRVTTTGEDGGAYVDRLTYLPSLGFAIYHGGADAGDSFVPDMPVAISTEPPMVNGDGVLVGAAAGNPTPAPAPAPAPEAPQPSK